MRKLAIILLSILAIGLVAGCSPEEAIHTELDAASDKAQVITRGQTGYNTYRVPRVDSTSRNNITIANGENRIHDGMSYLVSAATDVGSSGNTTFLIVVADSFLWPHMLWFLEHEAEVVIELYEEATYSNNGTAISSFNSNRNSNNEAQTLFYQTPVLTGLGTLLYIEHPVTAGSAMSTNEMMLKQNTTYVFRVSNQTGNSSVVATRFIFYEHRSEMP